MYSRGELVINHFPTMYLAGSGGSRTTRFAARHALVVDERILDRDRTNYYRQSYLYRTLTDWNNLPEHVALAENRVTFKHGTEEWVANIY